MGHSRRVNWIWPGSDRSLAFAMAVRSLASSGSRASRCRVMEPSELVFRTTGMALEGAEAARARSVLLEFLKFRVLAAQEEFFTALGVDQEPADVAAALRRWLAAVHWRDALDLSDADLLATLATARRLYVN